MSGLARAATTALGTLPPLPGQAAFDRICPIADLAAHPSADLNILDGQSLKRLRTPAAAMVH
jgi:hypothetical protein